MSAFWSRAMTGERRSFLGQVLTLVSGTVAAQAILVLASPFLTRIYSPDDFATLQMYTIWTGLIAAFASGRYELAIMIANDDSDRRTIAWLSLLLSVAISIVAGTLVVLFAYSSIYAVNLVGPPSIAIWLIPFGSLCYAWSTVVQRWEAWNNRFRTLASSQVYGGIVTVTLQFLLAYLVVKPSGTQLVIANLIGLFVTCYAMSGEILSDLWKNRADFRVAEALSAASKHWKFPAFSTGAHLLGRITVEVPKLMIGALFAPAALGLFSLSLRVSQLPLALIGQAFGHVFFRRVADCRGDGKRVQRLLNRSALLLLAIILPPMGVLYLWAEPLFGFVFGQNWIEAGTYARLLVPWMIAGFVVQPISYSLQAFEKQDMIFLWNVTVLPLGLAAVYLGYLLHDVRSAILFYSLSLMFMHMIYYGMCLKIAGGLGKGDPAVDGVPSEMRGEL
ncbi:MAG: oligosaccharide flippase family protein [Planctomycetaceae bacterium]|nr:oligosaccharide flippase family protein [Planctomycetaceae bacterium]